MADTVPVTNPQSDAFAQSLLSGATRSGYDATNASKRRKRIFINLKSEDSVLGYYDRDKLISEARRLRRNSSIVGWGVRTHLNNCAEFTFQCRSGVPEIDRRVESLWDWWGRAFNCDFTKRHTFRRKIRIIEGLAFTGGDCLVLKIVDTTSTPGVARASIQVIEGDRVRTPTDAKAYDEANGTVTDLSQFIHGVRRDANGVIQAYAICDRNDVVSGTVGYTLRQIVKAGDVFPHGYFDREDQWRGVTQLAGAINTFKDLYEAAEYALSKMKLAALFAMKFKHGPNSEAPDDTGDERVNLESGEQVLDFYDGDDAEFLETNTPSQEFQSYYLAQIQAGLKAMDLPYSFYDESHTNYSGSRLAVLHAENAAEDKRNNIRDNLLLPLAIWRIQLWIADGTLVLPDGMKIEDLNIEFIGAPLPSVDPQKDAVADEIRLALGLTSRSRLAKEDGNDFHQIAQELKDEENFLNEIGLKLDAPTPPNAGDEQPDPNQKDSPQEEDDEGADDQKGNNKKK